jgi:hypothetical protein
MLPRLGARLVHQRQHPLGRSDNFLVGARVHRH